MSLLEIKNLGISLQSGKVLVADASLTISAGEMFSLVGESGSGKSLTALSIMRLLGQQFNLSGSISFAGKNIETLPEAKMRALRGSEISMVFQEPMTALNPLHTIGKQVFEACKDHEKVNQLLAEVGLEYMQNRLHAYPHELSGGERQRVMIAMAIANNPKLLIADEPTTAVDVTIQEKLLALLKKLQQERGMAMLFITHDLTLVKNLSDSVAVMKEGKIVEQGKVSKVLSTPDNEYTKKLLESAPSGSAVELPETSATLISAEKINVSFPIKSGVFRKISAYKQAVENISLTLKQGETIGVVGESGSGKTTLAMAILRMVQSSGKIVFAGNELSELTKKNLQSLRKSMQLVFQDPYSSLNPRMTVGQIIAEGLKVHEPASKDHEERVRQALVDVGLKVEMSQRYPHEFSGGQRQRISIARALVLRPKLLVLDEPTSALDLTVQSQIIDLLRKFQKKDEVSYIVISHDLRVIKAISHRIMVLKEGKIIEYADTKTLFTNPQSPYTKTLIKAAWL